MGSLQKHGLKTHFGTYDSGTIYPHRIYRDAKQNIYHSVTHIF